MKSSLGYVAAVVGLALVSGACKTTTPAAQVDKVRGEITLPSSGDVRTALPDGSSQTDVRRSASALTRKTSGKSAESQDLLDLAQLQLVQGDMDGADASARRVLRMDTKSREARKTLAQVALRRSQIDLAEIFLNAIGGVDTKDSSVLNMLAMIELKRQNNARATALFKRALQVNPNDIAVRMNLGVMYLKYRQLGPASVQFERVVKVAPSHQDAKLHLAIIASARGENDKAEAIYKSILREKKDNPLALYNLAVLQKREGDYDDAIDSLKTYLRTAQGQSGSTDEVFALIDSINREKAAKGEEVSDREIQALAAKMSEKRDVATASPARKKPAKDTKAEKAEETFEMPAEEPAKQPSKSSGDEIEDLERELSQ